MDTELFNEKTIKRLCSNVNVSQKQKKNANDWIKLLESGALEKERTNYFRFALYILKDILGYSIREDLDYEKENIEFTFKNSIGKTVLCIEAKGDTQDLFSKQGRTKKEQSTPFKQTWDNMGRIDTIKYGICTNYRDFVLIDKSKGYSKYHFFDFLSIKDDSEKLKEFIAIFSKESIIDEEFIEKLYEKSIIEEREFTKEFYKLFHETRLMLIKEFQDNDATKDESIHYTQIFLNRLMFVFFAEDTGKLKQRLFEEKVLNLLKVDSVFAENTKLVCNLIKSIFQNLNEGSKRHNIFGFNGGLFKENIPDRVYFKDFRKKAYFDEIYQNSKIKNEIELDEKSKSILDVYNGNINPIILNLLYLASFDFNTEVSVNILGHIFEQSISDLEEIKEEKVLRRKKEGVYYTPDFITDYICRNTIITYLSKKGANTVDKLIDEYSNDIEELESKFKDLKILDPACGSGSFLLKAVEVLLEIHREVQIFKQDTGEYTAKKKASMKRWQKRGLKGDSQLTLVKWNEEDEAREIIENNIYGVDINEESVEITKLSLFFKIVKKNKKLIDLSNNIKCGNSLIEDSEIAGNKVFKWDEDFKEIMKRGGFDIIIGNPPYIRIQNLNYLSPEILKYFNEKYISAIGNYDIYSLFIEKGIEVLKKGGKIGYILPNKFFISNYGKPIREYLVKNKLINDITNFKDNQIFDGVSTYTCLLFLQKLENKKMKYSEIINSNNFEKDLQIINSENTFDDGNIKVGWMDLEELEKPVWIFTIGKSKDIVRKLLSLEHKLNDIQENFFQGVATSADSIYIVEIISDLGDKIKVYSNETNKEHILEKTLTRPLIKGKDLKKYAVEYQNRILIFPYIEENGNYRPLTDRELRDGYNLTYDYFEELSEKIKNREEGKLKNSDSWFALTYPRSINLYDKDKIITPNSSFKACFYLDNNQHFYMTCGVAGGFAIILKENSFADYHYILALLNSNLMDFFNRNIGTSLQGGYYSYDPKIIKKYPIKKISKNEQKPIISKSETLIELNKEFYIKKKKFNSRIFSSFNIDKISKKLDAFWEINFDEFIKEIYRLSKIKLSLKDQDEWEDYFNTYKKELNILQKQIYEVEKELDQMVYNLYGLTKDEIKIIENSFKE